MKINLGYPSTILKIILLALIALPLVNASAIFLDSTQQSACATDQLVISGVLENAKSLPDKFDLRVESASGLSAFVTPSLELDGYGVEKFNLFLSPVCLDVGTYDYKVIAESARGEIVSEKGAISINGCNLMELRISQSKTRVCNGESANFEISVVNLGQEEQNFTITTDLEEGSYTLSKAKFVLLPNQVGKATLKLNIPITLYAQGLLTFHAESQSTYSCGSNSRQIAASIEVDRCDGVKLSALPVVTVQANSQAVWNVFMDGQKTPDAYDLLLECPDFATLPKSSISLGGMESTKVNIPIYPRGETTGEYDCKLSATSRKFSKTYSVGAKIKVVQNYALVLVAPAEISVCKGEDALVKMKLINKGKENKYSLASSGEVDLSTNEIVAGENSTNDFAVKIDGNALEIGVNKVEVEVRSKYASAKSSTGIIVEDCYVSALSVTPRAIEMCAGDGIGETVSIKAANRGTKEDSFALSIADRKGFDALFQTQEAFRLAAGGQKTIDLKLMAPEGMKSGTYEIEIGSVGGNSKETASFNVVVLPVDVCHSLKFDVDGISKRTGAGIGKSFRVSITNNGRFKEKAELFLSKKPTWAYITPSIIEVLPGTKEEALIYFAPPLNEKLGNNPIVLEARGKYIQKALDLNVEVIALDTAMEAKIIISAGGIPFELEKDTETPIRIKLGNDGVEDLHNVNILFSELVNVVSQKPFDLEAGQEKEIGIVVSIGVDAGKEARKIKLGAYATEGSAELEIEIKPVESSLEVKQVESESDGGGFEVILSLKNIGAENMRLAPRSLEGANFSGEELELAAGEEKELTIGLREGRETLYFEDKISGKAYRKRIEVSEGGNITGLFTASLSKVAPLIIAIIAGALALYLIVSRRGRKGEEGDEGPKSPGNGQIYEEANGEGEEKIGEGANSAAESSAFPEEKPINDEEEKIVAAGMDTQEGVSKADGAKIKTAVIPRTTKSWVSARKKAKARKVTVTKSSRKGLYARSVQFPKLRGKMKTRPCHPRYIMWKGKLRMVNSDFLS
ncbi:MAG: hypothetical protein AABX01_01365 [Candidatus Micrarchaeota archaeon]